MGVSARTVATFRSEAFNTAEPRDHFINPGCFGDDLCRWLGDALRHRSIEAAEEPGQEDFGWYLRFSVPEGAHCCVVSFRPDDEGAATGTWVLWLERDRGFVASVLGRRQRGIALTATTALHEILTASDRVTDVRWHRKGDFDGGREDLAAPAP